MRELIAGLPAAALYRYKCHRGVTDVVPFQEANFATGAQFTIEIAPQPIDSLWKNMRKKKRSQIRRAQDVLRPITLQDPDDFYHFYAANIEQRGGKMQYKQELCHRLIEACYKRNRGCVYAAEDKNGALAAAIFCVWDQTAAYYFMTTRAPNAHDGAVSLVLWEAIQDATQRGLIFDFDGLTSKECFAFYSGFGGVLSPRYIVTRTTPLGGILYGVKESFRENRYFC